jgi:hypothetical protein
MRPLGKFDKRRWPARLLKLWEWNSKSNFAGLALADFHSWPPYYVVEGEVVIVAVVHAHRDLESVLRARVGIR